MKSGKNKGDIAVALRWLLMAFLAVTVLTGCALTRDAVPLNIIDPEPAMPAEKHPRAEWSLQVQRPVADQMRDSDRLLVRQDRALKPYPAVAWLDSAPDMLQGMMIQAFSDCRCVAAAVRPGAARARLGLATTINRFEAVIGANGRPRVMIDVQADLVYLRGARVISSQRLSVTAEAASDNIGDLVGAFEEALGQWLQVLIDWVVDTGLEHDAA